MSCRTRQKLARLIKDQSGAVAVTMAVMLTALVGITGAATDLGMLYTAKTQLQNAADASALAAADSMIMVGQDNMAVATPDAAWASAEQLAFANDALGTNLVLMGEDYTIGKWNRDLGDFESTGPSGNPDDINAVRVRLRRDEVANSPVTTMFARILGFDQVAVSSTSIAFLGYAGTAPAGLVDLPIVVNESAISDGDNPLCGGNIEFHDNNNQNGMWTTFFTSPSNDPTVRGYVTGADEVPELKMGDIVSVTNGNLSQGTFNALEQRFQSDGNDTDGDGNADFWNVILPVGKPAGSSSEAEITGFAHMKITAVEGAPNKNIVGHLLCGRIMPEESGTGDNNYGTRATNPKLIN